MYILQIPNVVFGKNCDVAHIQIFELDHMTSAIADCRMDLYEPSLHLGLGVDKPHRGRGLAQLLIAGAATINPNISLDVLVSNTPARKAYLRVGLKDVGYWDNDQCVRMEGKLDVEQILSHVRSKGTQFIIEKSGD